MGYPVKKKGKEWINNVHINYCFRLDLPTFEASPLCNSEETTSEETAGAGLRSGELGAGELERERETVSFLGEPVAEKKKCMKKMRKKKKHKTNITATDLLISLLPKKRKK